MLCFSSRLLGCLTLVLWTAGVVLHTRLIACACVLPACFAPCLPACPCSGLHLHSIHLLCHTLPHFTPACTGPRVQLSQLPLGISGSISVCHRVCKYFSGVCLALATLWFTIAQHSAWVRRYGVPILPSKNGTQYIPISMCSHLGRGVFRQHHTLLNLDVQ